MEFNMWLIRMPVQVESGSVLFFFLFCCGISMVMHYRPLNITVAFTATESSLHDNYFIESPSSVGLLRLINKQNTEREKKNIRERTHKMYIVSRKERVCNRFH